MMGFDAATIERNKQIAIVYHATKAKYEAAESACEAALNQPSSRGPGDFLVDDEEISRRESYRSWVIQKAFEDKDRIRREWESYVKIVGKNHVDLALTEIHQRIGDLPFIAE